MKKHGIVDQPFEDVEPTCPRFRRREGREFVFVLVGKPIEVVICAADGIARLAANPVVQVELTRGVNRILNHDADGLTDAGCTGVTLAAVERCGAQYQWRVSVEDKADAVVIGVGKRGTVGKINGLNIENHATRGRFNG